MMQGNQIHPYANSMDPKMLVDNYGDIQGYHYQMEMKNLNKFEQIQSLKNRCSISHQNPLVR